MAICKGVRGCVCLCVWAQSFLNRITFAVCDIFYVHGMLSMYDVYFTV